MTPQPDPPSTNLFDRGERIHIKSDSIQQPPVLHVIGVLVNGAVIVCYDHNTVAAPWVISRVDQQQYERVEG